MSVLQFAEQGIDHLPCGIIHRQKQCELRSIFSKPPVVAAVYLYQHPLTRHPLTTDSVFGWTPTSWAVLTGAYQQTTQRAASYGYAFVFTQQLAHMRMVRSSVPGACQMKHNSLCILRYRVGCSAPSMTVSNCGCSFPPVCR